MKLGLLASCLLCGCAQPEPFARETELGFMPRTEVAEPEPTPEPAPAATPSEPTTLPEPSAVPEPVPEPSPVPSMPLPSVDIDAATEPVAPPPDPPRVDSFSPEQSHWGAILTVTGSALGDATDEAAALTVGDAFIIAPEDDAYVVSWTESRIEFRVPFPEQGAVTVTTSVGSAPAGAFSSEWQLGTPYAAPDFPVASSLSIAPGSVALAFPSDPPLVARLDADGWHEFALDAPGPVLAESLHLYGTDTLELAAFALGEGRELWDFPSATDFTLEDPGIVVGDPAALAGGPDGGVVWQLTTEGWQRLRASSGAWLADGGPVADPDPTLPNRDVVATSAGSLVVAYSADTGNFLDDLGAPYFYEVSDDQTEFAAPVRGGSSVDDYVTSLGLVGRGRGFLIDYCGSDVDPLNLTGDSYRCYTAAHSDRGVSLENSRKEAEGARHAFTRVSMALAYCDGGAQLMLTRDDPAVEPGSVVAWPCLEAEVLEIDPLDEVVLIVRYQNELVPLRYVGETMRPSPDAGAPKDGGIDGGSASPGGDASSR